MAAPLLLRDGNFTPPARTPWGGTRIRTLKGLGPGDVIGESWEISVEPDFPSTLEAGEALDTVLRSDPAAWLGRTAAEESTSLLLKLVDADDELSVQIHPRDDYAGLDREESGKPESWYVVAREPGAGIYFGLRTGVAQEDVEHALAHEDDLSRLLTFVPVEPGDFLLIDAGTAHAIGRGVLLVEPQRVRPGRRGVTYRYWDWGRRYDAGGKLDPRGTPRALHVEHALAVTEWDAEREDALLAQRRSRNSASTDGPAHLEGLSGRFGGLASSALDVALLTGSGETTLPALNALLGLVVLEGEVSIGELVVPRGRAAVLPASSATNAIRLDGAHAIVAAAS